MHKLTYFPRNQIFLRAGQGQAGPGQASSIRLETFAPEDLSTVVF